MAIKTQEYKDFSWNTHATLGHQPNVAQMELTYACPLRCNFCYNKCYNTPESIRKNLSTQQVKDILDKSREAGVLWFCFTGGDPLLRPDFVEIYEYAKHLGFIITIFTSLTVLKDKILEAFKKSPPFCIETTLNGATRETYKVVTQRDLFDTHVKNIKKMIEHKIPIKVKSQITTENVHEVDQLKALVESLGLDFRPNTLIFASYDHDTSVCNTRLDPAKAVEINSNYGYYDEESHVEAHAPLNFKDMIGKPENDNLYNCAIGNGSYWIYADGKMSLCGTLNHITYDLLGKDATVRKGVYLLNEKIHAMKYETDSLCRSCEYRSICKRCPAKSHLETGSMEKHIDYFCKLTQETVKLYLPLAASSK